MSLIKSLRAWISTLFHKGAEMSNLNPLDGSPTDPQAAQVIDPAAVATDSVDATVAPVAATDTTAAATTADPVAPAVQPVAAVTQDQAQPVKALSDFEKLESFIDLMGLTSLKEIRAAIKFLKALV